MQKTALTLFLILTLLQLEDSCLAQNSIADYLAVHNAARAQVGVGPMTWDNKVAAYATNYVKQRLGDCNLIHSPNDPYGENLAIASWNVSARVASGWWVAEKADYNYASNSCAAGKMCGHYTQVVWRNSTRLGCARLQCKNGFWFISCNYDPPGNYIGERPY